MIDIHCHVLPGLDDGPRTLDLSLELLRGAARDGTRVVVATPHTFSYAFTTSPDAIREGVRRVNERAEAEGIPVTVLPGHEVHYLENLPGVLRSGDALTCCDRGRCVLVEFPARHVPSSARKVFFDLLIGGVTPIIAHPERNHEFLHRPELLEEFVSSGARVQITADSLLGAWGRAPRSAARRLLRQGLAHFLASDGHHPELRPATLSEGLREATRLVGAERAEPLVQDNPLAVVEGAPVPAWV